MPAWYAESGKTLVTNQDETSRRFYTTSHPFYRGIDLYARTMSAGILDQVGATLWPRHMTATPEALLKAITPSDEPPPPASAPTASVVNGARVAAPHPSLHLTGERCPCILAFA